MGISVNDIFIYNALYRFDGDGGGGRPSPNIVIDGELNNIFQNLSRMDHVKGDVSLRKVFLRVNSENDDFYADSHCALVKIPYDPLVELIMIPSAGHDEYWEDILAFIHDSENRKFFGASKFISNAFATSKVFGVNTLGTVLPMAWRDKTSEDEPNTFENFVWNDRTGGDDYNFTIYYCTFAAWTADAVSQANGLYYVETQNYYELSGGGGNRIYVFVSVNGEWTQLNGLGGQLINPKTGNASSYSKIGEGIRFTLPDNIIADSGSQVVMYYSQLYKMQTVSNGTYLNPMTYNTKRFACHLKNPVETFSMEIQSTAQTPVSLTIASHGDVVSGIYNNAEFFGAIDRQFGIVKITFPLNVDAGTAKKTYEYDEPINRFPGWNPLLFPIEGKLPIFNIGVVILFSISSSTETDEMCLITNIDYENNTIWVQSPLQYDHNEEDAIVSSVLELGNLQAKVVKTFSQASWDLATWSDNRIGDPAMGNYDLSNYPILVTNRGATTGRWIIRIKALSPLTADIISQYHGTIATNVPLTQNIGDPSYPAGQENRIDNPVSGYPYFFIDYRGWGGNWQVGNILRINTEGAEGPFWILRSVKPSQSDIMDDSGTIIARGDVATIIEEPEP